MSAFQPISPRAALELLEAADVGLDCARLLVDLAEAGLVKGYARLVETAVPGQATSEIRDSRIARTIWKRIVAEDKVADLYAAGSVRLGADGGPAGSVSVLGIRFEEKSVRTAAVQHGAERPPLSPHPKSPAPVQTRSASPVAAAPEVPAQDLAAPRRTLAPDAVGASVTDAAAVLGLSRGTIYKLIDAGTLESKKVGARRLVSADSIRALLA